MDNFPKSNRRASAGYYSTNLQPPPGFLYAEKIPKIKSVPDSLQRFASQQLEQPPKCQEEKECQDFDDIIDHVGSDGKYQKLLLHFAISPMSAIQPILAFNAVFMLFTPLHWCSAPDRPMWDDAEEFKLVNIPRLNGTDGVWKYSSCLIYDENRTQVDCTSEWEYDKTFYEKTMTSENNWVCDKREIPTYALLSGTVGNAFGTLAFGLLSDVWGRKPTLFLAILVNVLFRLLSVFSGNKHYVLYITQFCVGLTHTTLYILPALIAAEVCNRDQRAEVYATTWTICLVGLAILPTISWLCGNWFIIGLVTAALGALMLLYYPAIFESPRWLLQKGKVDEAAKILKKIQTYNNGKLQIKGERTSIGAFAGDTIDSLKDKLRQILNRQKSEDDGDTKAEGKSFKILFKKKTLARHTALLTICWSMNTLIYTAMTFHSIHMTGSHFKNFFLLAIIEVPSGFFGGYMADTLGRRWTQTLAFGLCALGCFGTSIVVHQREMEILFATFAKLSVTVSFLVTYLQATELFPTELRSSGSGVASTIGNFIAISGPVIANLSSSNATYPWLTMGALSLIGVIASAFLPETLNLGLPETIDEANNIGKNQKFWSISIPERDNKNAKNFEK